jgi:two-component system, NarL family, nitrate/nitrite response regulator NarL
VDTARLMQPEIQILAIDDHPLFIEGLKMLLTQQGHPSAMRVTNNASDALALLDTGFEPDLVLLDLNLPGMGGFSLLRILQQRGLMSPVLVVSASQSIHDARSAMESGAMGFVSKASRSNELLEAIDTVLEGEPYLPPEWRDTLDSGSEKARVSIARQAGITGRQMEILHLLAQGYANKMIAYELGLSEATVKVHLREVFKTLKVTNRTACVKAANDMGLLQS